MDCRIPVTPFITSLCIVIFCFIFCLHAKNHLYTANSIEDFLFTPGDMMQLEKLCQTMPKLDYHSATETNPLVINLRCVMSQTAMDDFLFRQQFLQISHNVYKKDDKQLRLSGTRHGLIHSVTFIKD